MVGVHQNDCDREIRTLSLSEHCAGGVVRFVGCASLGNARQRFCGGKGGALALIKQMSGFRPSLYQRDFLDLLPLPDLATPYVARGPTA